MNQTIAVLFGFAFLYSLVAARLERTPIAGAVVFIGFGLLVGPFGLSLLDFTVQAPGLRFLAEMTLALVLFVDAASANLAVLRRNLGMPERLLLVGLPLTILLGIATAALLFRTLGWVGCALLGTMLAPTDAALGKAVVTNTDVPAPMREALNVESGLNDGICVPVLLVFLEIAAEPEGAHGITALALHHVVAEIGIGMAVGVGLAAAGQRAMRFAAGRDWVSESWRQLPVMALAFTIFGAAQALGGSGFIACFAGGLVAGALAQRDKRAVLLAAEGAGDLFSLITWVAFGAAVVGQAVARLTWPVLAYALLSLTVVRMLPVYVAMAGSGVAPAGRLFLGWFGPRGLASVVFAVMVLDAGVPGGQTMIAAVAWTVILSIVAHGITAVPLAAAFARLGRAAPGAGA